MYMTVRYFDNPVGTLLKSRRENSGGADIRLRLSRDELRNMVIGGFRLSDARFDDLSPFVQRPEGVAEQVRWVVFSFELYESVPALAKTSLDLVRTIAAAEELRTW